MLEDFGANVLYCETIEIHRRARNFEKGTRDAGKAFFGAPLCGASPFGSHLRACAPVFNQIRLNLETTHSLAALQLSHIT